VVGGRAFTSAILQKNCHEFISYENLVGVQSLSRKISGRTQVSSPSALENALPLIRRALKVLSDREVSPQLGLLKSTLLQLDSTFSERDYGVSSFRDFIQKLADAGYANLKQVDRSLLVELKEIQEEGKGEMREPFPVLPEPTPEVAALHEQPTPAGSASEASRVLEELLRDSRLKPHWPMYLRTFKQFLRSLQPPFDERQYGLSSTYDLARQANRDGLLRVERNRQGILRIFPGERFPQPAQEQSVEEPASPIIPSSEPEMSSPEAPLEMEPPVALAEPPPESVQQPEPQIPSEAVGEEVQKPKPKRRRKTASTGSARPGKGETRKTKPRERSKD